MYLYININTHTYIHIHIYPSFFLSLADNGAESCMGRDPSLASAIGREEGLGLSSTIVCLVCLDTGIIFLLSSICISASLLSNCGNQVFTLGELVGAGGVNAEFFELTLLL
jgi:hypothetical protein